MPIAPYESWVPQGGTLVRPNRNDDRALLNGLQGTYKPVEGSTAGFYDESALTLYTGTATPAAGTVLENCIFDKVINLANPNIVIRNFKHIGPAADPVSGISLFNCDSSALDSMSNSQLPIIEDGTIEPQNPHRFMNGFYGNNFTARRIVFKNLTDAFTVRDPPSGGPLRFRIYSNIIGPFAWHVDAGQGDNQTHNDGVQFQGGTATSTGQWNEVIGNLFNGQYNSDASDPGVPALHNAAFVGIQWTNLNGYTTNCLVKNNWIYGFHTGISAGTAVSTNIGSIIQNWFDDNQGAPLGHASGNGYTINLDPTTTCVTGDGTSNANTYEVGVPVVGGQEVNVRRNM